MPCSFAFTPSTRPSSALNFALDSYPFFASRPAWYCVNADVTANANAISAMLCSST